jgi:hypothetical protein
MFCFSSHNPMQYCASQNIFYIEHTYHKLRKINDFLKVCDNGLLIT